MIAGLLVANRGEIARRIFRTARNMGIRTVAVFSEADSTAPFVTEADSSIRLHGGYLAGDEIIEAALRAGADAIHPGYGFLSENAEFAQSVIDAGLVWVGPAPETIALMGDKLAAKTKATEAGVATLPGSDYPERGEEVGYPLLVKASAGGGGKGMRLVTEAGALADAVAAAQREALAGFGDATVFLERYVERSRHIEIQVLGDNHGNLVHLGERECSIQRRHQKVIEETPSTALDAATRSAMTEAALALAGLLDYHSAGTIEFLFDDQTNEFFFLEANTRLQVEHPVTEAVTGIDLVREQIRIAAGEPLGFEQSDITFSGSSIEVRLYAEDPDNGFLPATGTLAAFKPPTTPAVRWDSGVEQGSVVGIDFDPLLAKAIAHAPTRTEAAGRLALALEHLHLGGVVTNREFLAAALRSQPFLDGQTTTDFIERSSLVTTASNSATLHCAVGGALWIQHQNWTTASVLAGIPSGWRNARLPDQKITLTNVGQGGAEHTVSYHSQRDGSFLVDGSQRVLIHHANSHSIDVEVDGKRSTMAITQHGGHLYVQSSNSTLDFRIEPRFVLPAPAEAPGGFVAPMPGTVVEIRVEVGAAVTAGETLVVLEAMKMEHHVNASHDGAVTEVRIAAGSQVELGQVLLQIESDEGTGE